MPDHRFEESILRSLRRIIRALDIQSKQLAQHHQLTGPQLVCLRELSRLGRCTPSELARVVSVSQGTMTGILDRLEARGLVERERDPSDRRRHLLSITEAGAASIKSAPSSLHERFSRRLRSLEEGEQAMIAWVLGRVVDMMEASEIDAAPMLSPDSALTDEVSAYGRERSGEVNAHERSRQEASKADASKPKST